MYLGIISTGYIVVRGFNDCRSRKAWFHKAAYPPVASEVDHHGRMAWVHSYNDPGVQRLLVLSMAELNKSKPILIHLVEKQLFYAPLYLAVNYFNRPNNKPRKDGFEIHLIDKHDVTPENNKFNLSRFKADYDVDFNKTTGSGIVTLLHNKEFQDASPPGMILSGDKDMMEYHEQSKNVNIVTWYVFVIRLPIMLIHKGKRRRLEPMDQILAPRLGTTLHKYLTYFKQPYRGTLMNETEGIESIPRALQKNDALSFGFSTGSVQFPEQLKINELFRLPSEAIQFTCFFSTKKLYEDKEYHQALIEFFQAVELASEELYKDTVSLPKSGKLWEDYVKQIINAISPEAILDTKMVAAVTRQLNYFASRRIWHVDLMTGAQTFYPNSRLYEYNTALEKHSDLFHGTPLPDRVGGEKFFTYEEHQRLIDLFDQRENEARRSACSTVMSRNMSHNIGSHVLARLTERRSLDKTPVIILLNYLKHRQEFIADIVTARAVVTFNRYLYQDVLSRFLPVSEGERQGGTYSKNLSTRNPYYGYPHLLLEYISGKNDIREKDISLKLNSRVGEGIRIKTTDVDRTVENDLLVSLPNDILGCHALFVILENIIRNAAKHSIVKTDTIGTLELTIVIDDTNGDYYKITVVDNLGEKNRENRSQDLLSKLRRHITDSILDDGRLRDGGWGFVEMKICAAYLIRFPVEEIDSGGKDGSLPQVGGKVYPRLLEIDFFDDKGRKCEDSTHYNLGISFHLVKPKLVQVIDVRSEDGAIFSLANNEFRKVGIHTGRLDGFENYGTDHEFLALMGNDAEQASSIEQETNQRVVCVTEQELNTVFSKDVHLTRESLYSKYFDENINATVRDPLFSDTHHMKFEDDDLTNGIMFDNHGDWGRSDDGKKKKHLLRYYEPYGSQSLTNTLFVAPYRSESNPILRALNKFEINEAARTEIVLLDERVQSAALGQDVDQDPKRIDVLNSTGVYVPSVIEANLGDNVIDKKKVLDFINLKRTSRLIEYLVIHLGIIEDLTGSTDIESIYEWIKATQKDIPKVVVTSGRGLPSNLPKNVLYVPISLIYQYTISYPSKIMLNKVLRSIRKNKQVR